MKNKVLETFFSLLALYLFACGLATAVVLGILFIPLIFITLLVLVVREVNGWKRKTGHLKHGSAAEIKANNADFISSLLPYRQHHRAA